MVEKCLDVVICTYTEERLGDLLASVKSVQTQEFAGKHIIVVVDHNPALAAHLRSILQDVTIVENAHRKGLSGGRNTGIEQGNSPVVVFLDDDAAATPGWLERIWNSYSDPSVLAVGGASLPAWETSAPRWFPEEFGWVVGCSYLGQPKQVSAVRNVLGSNMSLRREVFDRVGGFSDTVGRIGKHPTGCEETELCIRAVRGVESSKVIYDPEIVVNHTVRSERTKVSYFLRRCWFEGRSKAYVSSLVGARDGISQERSYTLHTLPRGVLRGLYQMVRRGDLYGGARSGFIAIGLAITITGYLSGRVNQLYPGASDLHREGQGEEISGAASAEAPFPRPGEMELGDGSGDVPDDSDLPRATVVVPSIFARPEQLKLCLDSLISLDYPDFEIIVVDNRPDDSESLEHWSSFHDRVRIVPERFRGISAARNRGVAEASGEIVAFTDDDVEVDPSWLRNLVIRLLSSRDIGCVTGLVLARELETPSQRWFEEYLGGFNRGSELKVFCPSPEGATRFTSPGGVGAVICTNVESKSTEKLSLYEAIARCGAGASMAFRREVLLGVGGFNPALGTGTPSRGGEDLAMFAATLLARKCIAYDPKALVHHSHRRSYAELAKQVSGSGIGLTAMLSSLAWEDPRHLLAIGRKVPLALSRVARLRFGGGDAHSSTAAPTYPPSLRWHEIAGMAKGPVIYFQSRRFSNAESEKLRARLTDAESENLAG